jgi:ABC-type glycerol-3-phosphate transport system substrate-binding protein
MNGITIAPVRSAPPSQKSHTSQTGHTSNTRGQESPAGGTPATRRRVLGAGLAGAAGLVVAACGTQSTQPGAPSITPATVRYLHFDTGQPIWQQSWGEIFTSFQAKYPGSTVQTDLVTGTLPLIAEKAIASYAGGGVYEVFYGHFTILAPFLGADIIQPLDSFLSKDKEVKADDYFPAATERMKGKLYGIAWFTQGKEIFYNANLLQQSGAPLPRQLEKEGKWTWDALLDVAKKVTRTEGDAISVYGFNTSFSDPGSYLNTLYSWGADFYDKGITRPTIDTPAFLSATQFSVDLVSKHKVAGGGNFQQGKLGILLSSGSSTRGWDEQIVRPNLFQIEHTMLPKGPAGRADAISNNCLYLGKGTKVPDAAWAFYKHMLSADVQKQVAQLGGGRYTANKKLKPLTVFAFEDAAVYEASAAMNRPTPLIVKQSEFQKDWADAWKDMVEGNKGVKDALTLMQERTTMWLKEGCIC